MKSLLDFAILSQGLCIKDKIKLILFALRLKPVTSIYLLIAPNNLSETYQLEHALRLNKILYLRGREKSFEEIKRIKENKIHWDLKGLWLDYDLFHTHNQKDQFQKYKLLWQQGKLRQAHLLAGKLYDYPPCCITQYSQETPSLIKKKYTSYHFYKRLHELDKRFPLLSYMPCSVTCKKALAQQKLFSHALKDASLSFFNHVREIIPYETTLIVDGENDILKEDKSIWPKKDGHDYVVLSTKLFRGKYWFYTVLSKKIYHRGTVLSATIKHHATYGDIILGKEKGIIPDLQHDRNLPLLKREY